MAAAVNGPALLQAVLDELGGGAGCSVLSPSGDFVVGRPEAVYLYSHDGRGPCFVVEGAALPGLPVMCPSCDLHAYQQLQQHVWELQVKACRACERCCPAARECMQWSARLHVCRQVAHSGAHGCADSE